MFGSLLVTSCSTVPVTGRKQFNLVSETEVVRMSIISFEQMKTELRVSNDPVYNEMLQRIGFRLSQEVFSEVPLAEWEFVVFDSPEVNAFAMPGGKVGIYEGLFKIVKTEDELASVIAHEIAHVTARHTHERFSQAMLTSAGGTVLQVATLGSGIGGIGYDGIMGLYGMGASVNTIAWDRAKETEADKIGLIYMARAGYDPEAAITVMERMAELSFGKPDPWYSTHPSSEDRLNALHGKLGEANEIYKNATVLDF